MTWMNEKLSRHTVCISARAGAMMWALCLLLTLKGIRATSDTRPTFGVFVPPDLYYPSEEKFCIHTYGDLKDYSFMTVNLKTASDSTTLHMVTPQSPFWDCVSFAVPEPSKDREGVHIEVQGIKVGGNKETLATKQLTLCKKSIGTFIQTDKSVNKPKQLVQFRIFTINQDLEVLNDNYSLIQLQDPQRNRLAQRRNVSPTNGKAELSSQRSPEPALGKYTIKADWELERFEIQEYVLPKFDVMLEAPEKISVLDDLVSVKVFGLYNHGEKVHGNVLLKVCQKGRQWYRGRWWSSSNEETRLKELCHTEAAKTDGSGSLRSLLNLAHFNLRSSDYDRELNVEATLEEEGTEVKINTAKSIKLESQITRLSFKDTKSYFQPGAPYRGKLSLTTYDGRPLGSKNVHLTVKFQGKNETETFTTDSNGEATFQLATGKWGKNSVSLEATTDEKEGSYEPGKVRVHYGKAYFYISDIHVETQRSLHIRPVRSSAPCDQNVTVTVDYVLEEEDRGTVEFFYLVVVEGRISHHSQTKVEGINPNTRSGSLEISLPVRDISPSGKMLCFVVSMSGAVAADTTTLQVMPYLKHAVPNLVRVQRTHIRDQLSDNYCNNKNPETSNRDDPGSNSETVRSPDAPMYHPWQWHVYPQKKKDVTNIVEGIGIYLLGSWKAVAPITCHRRRIRPVPKVSSAMPAARRPPLLTAFPEFSDGTEAEKGIGGGSGENIRTSFPDTWIRQLRKIPSSGLAKVPVTAPDAITEWRGQMSCVGSRGFGQSSANLFSFQPFFTSLDMPASVIQGETFYLIASVCNCQSRPMMIRSSLPVSEQFTLEDASDATFCLAAGQIKTISWKVTPTVLGRMNISVISEAVKSKDQCDGQETVVPEEGRRDAVVQPLLVKPEGTLVERTHNSMLSVAGTSISENVTLELPQSSVAGSEKAFMSFTGDIMGRSLNNMDSLLAMSYGCGEQNMVRFATNVNNLQYLRSSGQLTPALLEKSKKLMESGRDRQMNYKHPDASFSAFGKSDEEGSTWLTAFVLKTFSQAKNFVYIDEETLRRTLSWLKAQQKDNGCFHSGGRRLNNALKGGVDDEVSLSTYCTIALLESGLSPRDTAVERGLACIRREPLTEASLYKLALKAYAYSLANCTEDHSRLMQLLYAKANRADGMLYWSQEAGDKKGSYWSNPKSEDVAISAYTLLSMIAEQQPSKQEVDNMAAIVPWLFRQQNGNGGFMSTQDTVVALQAVALYGSMVPPKSEDVMVDVASDGGFHHRLQLSSRNQLLLQRVPLPKVPGQYTVTVSGTGTAYMQVTQRHHSRPAIQEAPFSLEVESQCVTSNLLEISAQFWYSGGRSNGAVLECGMLSGYRPQEASIEAVKQIPGVKWAESEDDMVTIYLEEVTAERQTLSILAERSVMVTGLKAAAVKLFNYDTSDEECSASYLSECL